MDYPKFLDYNIRLATNDMGCFAYLKNERFIGEILNNGEVWEPTMVKFYTNLNLKDKTVINAGAHVGSHAVILARLCNTIYAFEPQNILFWLLNANLANDSRNVTNNFVTFKCALGHTEKDEVILGDWDKPDGVVNYERGISNFGGVGILGGKGNIKTKMITIDTFDDETNGEFFGNVGLLLFDMEGAERLALYGAKETIKRCRPVILFEQNYKTVTQPMIDALNISEEVCNFNIFDYTLKLGYNTFINITDTDLALIPLPDDKVVLPHGKYHHGWELKCTPMSEWSNRFIFVMNGRSDAQIAWYEKDKIFTYFPDDIGDKIYMGIILENGTIFWSNGNYWYPVE